MDDFLSFPISTYDCYLKYWYEGWLTYQPQMSKELGFEFQFEEYWLPVSEFSNILELVSFVFLSAVAQQKIFIFIVFTLQIQIVYSIKDLHIHWTSEYQIHFLLKHMISKSFIQLRILFIELCFIGGSEQFLDFHHTDLIQQILG